MKHLPSHTFTLETERMFLRPLEPSTFSEAFTLLEKEEQLAFFGYRTEEEMKREREMFEYGSRMFGKSIFMFHLILKETGTTLGTCGYHTLYTRHQRAELGYNLHYPEYREQGLMKEALLPTLEYGFGNMKLERIEAFVEKGNTPSEKLLQRFGFLWEGTARKHYRVDGVNTDSEMYSLTDEDWGNWMTRSSQ
jgi:ribosomal-protein-alanine N-acetyltransferase